MFLYLRLYMAYIPIAGSMMLLVRLRVLLSILRSLELYMTYIYIVVDFKFIGWLAFSVLLAWWFLAGRVCVTKSDGLRICSLSSDVSVSGILDTEHNDLYCSERIPKIKSNLAIAKGCSLFKILYES